MSNAIIADENNFEEVVLHSGLPVVVDFWSTTCQPCKMLAPILERLSDVYAGRLTIVKVCANENPNLVMKLGVSGVPTLKLYYKGEAVHIHAGFLPEPDLRTLFDEFLKCAAG